jgi:hypothetical protein
VVEDLPVLVSNLLVPCREAVVVEELALFVKDEKGSLASTESRNWPFGDSNLKSMVMCVVRI